MLNHRTSYWKTAIPTAAASALVLVATAVFAPADGLLHTVAIAVGTLVALPPLLVAASGFMVLHRDATVTNGRQDLFHTWNRARSEAALAAGPPDRGLRLRQIVRGMLAPLDRARGCPERSRRAPDRLMVGDEIEIRSFEEIRRTLDDDDSLDGLPFMPEMLPFCGQRARVFRRVDKIYDYGGKKVLRRLRGTVLLRGLRCSGDAHGHCDAGCYLMWKEAWLKQVPAPKSPPQDDVGTGFSRPVVRLKADPTYDSAPDDVVTYRCQFTQLVAASTPVSPWDPRLDFRPLAAGNVTLATFLLALMTRLFNCVQAWRGGSAFPPVTHLPASAAAETRSVAPGDLVRVRPATSIFKTLDKNLKNRGLWFDRDMLKHCGHEYTVSKRVDRIIDDATGRMRTMKTPCIVLRGVTYSGEFLRFLAQEDPLYWREAWLSPADPHVDDVGLTAVATGQGEPDHLWSAAMSFSSLPLVTIGMPVYNSERHLRQSLDSLLAQTYRDFVLVISDNASTDSTAEICQQYVQRDPRVQYFRNPVNVGMTGNFNRVFELTNTKYIKWSTADDFWAPDMIADAVAVMEADPSVVVCYPQTTIVDDEGREQGPYIDKLHLMEDDPAERFVKLVDNIHLVNHHLGLLRTDAVRRTRLFGKHVSADIGFLAEMSLYGKFYEVRKRQFFRRFHVDSSSWNRGDQEQEARRFHAANVRRMPFNAWRFEAWFWRAVLRSPLSLTKKARLLWHIARRTYWRSKFLLDDLRRDVPVALGFHRKHQAAPPNQPTNKSIAV